MKKILMAGTGTGHNIQKWFHFFDLCPEGYHLFFLADPMPEHIENKNIRFVDFSRKAFLHVSLLFPMLSVILFARYDALVLQGAYDWKRSFLLMLLVHAKRKIIVPWGMKLIEMAKQARGMKKWIYRFIFHRTSNISVTYSTREGLRSYDPSLERRFFLMLWGADWKQIDTENPPTPFCQDLLNTLQADDIMIFYPRSIIPLSRFDLLIRALAELRGKIPDVVEHVRLIIWHGNVTDSKWENTLRQLVNELQMEKNIRFVEHPFLPQSDIGHLWKRCDFSVNLIENDGFSSQLMEAFYFRKPLLLSDIPAYSLLKEATGLPLNLVALDDFTGICQKLRNLLEHVNQESDKDLTLLHDYAATELNQDQQFSRLLDHCK